MRRAIAGAVVGLLACAVAAPVAVAHDNHVPEWKSQNSQPPLAEGDVVFSTDFLRLQLDTFDDVESWKIVMTHEATGAESKCVGGFSDESNPTFECFWDTEHIGDMKPLGPGQSLTGAAPSPNGVYAVTGEITVNRCVVLNPCQLQPHQAPSFKVTVTNDLAKPAAPQLRTENGRIFVNWAPNPEPDATYTLQERVNGGAWADHARGGETRFERPGDEGTYEYRVVAQRPYSTPMTSDIAGPLPVFPPPPADPGAVAPPPDPTTSSTAGATPATTRTTSKPKASSVRPRPTEQSRGLNGSTLFSRPTPSSVRPSPGKTTPTTVDDGFSEALTYPTAPPKVIETPGEPVAIERIITEERPVDVRGMLIPLAGGLAVFVFAMQMIFMARRRPNLATTLEDDWA